jgi:decaprenylphospho-beta-D-ribofuranose 2-oxidase
MLRVDAAATVGAVHDLLETSGLDFPIYGGTQWATVGGAVAGDIHGKNHSVDGSFACHVAGLSLVTASGARLECSPAVRSDLFAATLGGMGLTGLIETVDLRLRRARARTVRVERFALRLEDLYQRLEDERPAFHFSAWFDLAEPGARGLHFEAESSDAPCPAPRRPRRLSTPRLPLIGAGAIRLAGRLVMARSQGHVVRHMHIRDFNYSGLHERLFGWNQLYGRAGMIEYQFVVAEDLFPKVLEGLVVEARRHSVPMLAAVIKRLGDKCSPGLLSFPRPGLTVNFQTPWSASALHLLSGFSDVLGAAGGRVNLTKDCCIAPRQFARMYDQLDDWQAIVRRYDPEGRIRSAMAERLHLKPW